ncbi:hypothetical protein [Ferruginibacter profundus]
MKTTTKLDITISRDEMEVLTKEVKETLAFEHLKHHKIFTSADLWNIQRQKKSTTPRRNYA